MKRLKGKAQSKKQSPVNLSPFTFKLLPLKLSSVAAISPLYCRPHTPYLYEADFNFEPNKTLNNEKNKNPLLDLYRAFCRIYGIYCGS
jgi:hypothetical protein